MEDKYEDNIPIIYPPTHLPFRKSSLSSQPATFHNLWIKQHDKSDEVIKSILGNLLLCNDKMNVYETCDGYVGVLSGW